MSKTKREYYYPDAYDERIAIELRDDGSVGFVYQYRMCGDWVVGQNHVASIPAEAVPLLRKILE